MLYRVHVQYKSAVTDTRHSNVTRCSPCCIPAKTKEHKHTQSPLNAQWLCTSMYSFFCGFHIFFTLFTYFSHLRTAGIYVAFPWSSVVHRLWPSPLVCTSTSSSEYNISLHRLQKCPYPCRSQSIFIMCKLSTRTT